MFAHGDERGKRAVPAPSETQESIPEPTRPAALAKAPPPRPAPAPAPTPTPTPTPTPRKAAEPVAPERLDEASLIAKLHDLAASDPPQSLKLARDALDRFPESPQAPELEWNVVKALANMDRYREAEEEARAMLQKYPNSPFSVDVEHHVLNHPPNPR